MVNECPYISYRQHSYHINCYACYALIFISEHINAMFCYVTLTLVVADNLLFHLALASVHGGLIHWL